MSKAILVIDMPKSCAKCPFVKHEDEGWLYCNLHSGDTAYAFKRADWCPLKEAPQKKKDTLITNYKRYVRGWNDCMDRILEGSEEDE